MKEKSDKKKEFKNTKKQDEKNELQNEVIKEKIIFRGNYFQKLFWIFVFGSVLGTLYEELLFFVENIIYRQELVWAFRRGVIWGPFNPLYGLGAVIMAVVLVRKKDKPIVTFLKAAILGGAFEFICSLMQEFVLGTVAWDYSNHFLNIGGRTTLPFMVVWGILGLLFVKFAYPKIMKMIEKAKPNVLKKIEIFLMIFLILDMIISWTALLRQTLRHNGVEPKTVIDRIYDDYFDDDYLEKRFPNTINK